jgi:molecular chaperone GrpE
MARRNKNRVCSFPCDPTMTENETKTPTPDAPADDQAVSADGQAESAEAREKSPWEEGGEADLGRALAAEIERLESEKADLTDRLVRLAADMDNLRKRTDRELIDARKYAVSKFAADMLVVGDNLRRALGAVPADHRESADEAWKALMQGVEMTEREMDRLLEKNGVTRIVAVGERFDPHRHQAMFEIPDPSVATGTVVQVVQEGYQIGDRVLRAALVGVSKDGPKTTDAEGQGEAAADQT